MMQILKKPQTFPKKPSIEKFGGKSIFASFASLPTDRAAKYVSKIPGAVSGQHGHDQTFAVAVALLHGFALAEGEAWPILMDYAARCQPPWSLPELRHKFASAQKLTRHSKPRGHLLGIESRPRPERAAPRRLGRITLPSGAVGPSPQQTTPPALHEIAADGSLKLAEPTVPTGPQVPPDFCPTCWRQRARALRPGRCICTGHVTTMPSSIRGIGARPSADGPRPVAQHEGAGNGGDNDG